MINPESEFVRLLERCQGILHKICRAYCPVEDDRKDLFQEIALQLWRAWPQFRGEAKESTWIYRVALNVAISGARRRKTPRPDELTEKMHGMPGPDESAGDEQVAMMYHAIHTLSDVEKALVLLYFEEKTLEEIAAVTGITAGNVRVKMHRIREKLRQRIKQINES